MEKFAVFQHANADYWKRYKRTPGYHNIGACPELRFSKRLKTTLGRAHIEEDPAYTVLSVDYVEQYPEQILDNWLHHELAHHVAFRVYGDKGHGAGWYQTLRDLGIKTTRCHTLINRRWSVSGIRRKRVSK